MVGVQPSLLVNLCSSCDHAILYTNQQKSWILWTFAPHGEGHHNPMLSPLQRASAKDKNNPNKHRKQGHLKFISAPLAPSRRRGDPRYFNKAHFGLALNFTNLTIPEDYTQVPKLCLNNRVLALTTSFAEALSISALDTWLFKAKNLSHAWGEFLLVQMLWSLSLSPW